MTDLIMPETWKLDPLTNKVICQDCGSIVFMGLCNCVDKKWWEKEEKDDDLHALK